MLIFENFSGGIAPKPPYWEGATAPLPRPHPPRRSDASRLRASLGTFGPSIDECGVQKIPYIILWSRGWKGGKFSRALRRLGPRRRSKILKNGVPCHVASF